MIYMWYIIYDVYTVHGLYPWKPLLGSLPHVHSTAIWQDIQVTGAAGTVLHPILRDVDKDMYIYIYLYNNH